MLKKLLNRAPYRIFLALFIIVVVAFSSGYLVLRNATNAIYSQTKLNARLTAKSMRDLTFIGSPNKFMKPSASF